MQARSESAWWLREGMKDTALNCADDTPLDWYSFSRGRNESPDLVRTASAQRELF